MMRPLSPVLLETTLSTFTTKTYYSRYVFLLPRALARWQSAYTGLRPKVSEQVYIPALQKLTRHIKNNKKMTAVSKKNTGK